MLWTDSIANADMTEKLHLERRTFHYINRGGGAEKIDPLTGHLHAI